MKNLVTKLVRVMSAAKRVAKNGKNTFHNYEYATEADVMEMIREPLIKENVFITSSVENSHRDNDFVSVVVLHTLIDGDSGESIQIKSLGIGQDKGDKAANKAVTAACKYFILKNFLVPTGDDPEATDADGKSTGPTKSSLKAVPDGMEPKAKKYGFSNKVKDKPAEPIAVGASSDEL